MLDVVEDAGRRVVAEHPPPTKVRVPADGRRRLRLSRDLAGHRSSDGEDRQIIAQMA